MGYKKPRPQHKDLAVRRGLSGLGLFATAPIPKGTFIIEYWGEVVSEEEGNRRGGKYLFELEGEKVIDGTTRKNTARYINHSHKPNCEPEEDNGRIFISTKRAVKEGEELTYDYGRAYCKEHCTPCRCAHCVEKGSAKSSKKGT